jgi:hypothetical protein
MPLLALPGLWAHPAWYGRTRPARSSREARHASACLLERFAPLAQLALPADSGAATTLLAMTRREFARACRLSAAFETRVSLRRVVAGPDVQQVVALLGVTALHAVLANPAPARRLAIDWHDRDTVTAIGLASLQAQFAQAQWRLFVSLRLRPAIVRLSEAHDTSDGSGAALALAFLRTRTC